MTDKTMLDEMQEALNKAKDEFSKACYLEDCGSNAGIRKMNSNRANWLRWVIYLAEHGLKAIEDEERLVARREFVEDENVEFICDNCPVSAESLKLIKQKDKTIKELRDKLNEITERLKSLQITYDCELEYRKALAQRAKIDHFTEVLKLVHDRCWLDGTVLVTPVEYLDKTLLELIKE